MTKKIKSNLEHALHYSEKLEFSVIPVKPKDKKPLGSWKKFQTEKASREQIRKWWTQNPDAGIGIMCGPVSGIFVVDIDEPKVFQKSGLKLPASVSVKTFKGFHAFFRIPHGTDVPSGKLIYKGKPFGDLKSAGGYVVAPPSTHPKGVVYKWLTDMPKSINYITEASPELLSALSKFGESKKQQGPVLKGDRNNAVTSYAGKILQKTGEKDWESVVLPAIKHFNDTHCQPPLAPNEVLGIFKSISSAERRGRKEKGHTNRKTSQADKAVRFVMDELNLEPFHDDKTGLYVRVKIDGHYENWNCDSDELKNWLSKEYYNKFKEALRPDNIRGIIEMLRGKAKFEGHMYPLKNRMCFDGEALHYDLVSKNWESVRINEHEWEIIENTPPLFKRFSHQLEQVRPLRGGKVHEILDFVNIQDKEQKVLFLVFLVSAFIPDFPHPMPYFYGPHGSAKSTVCQVLRKVIDPSLMGLGNFPKNEAELVQIFDHHAIYFFDNMSFIKDYQSDILCKVITGGSFSKRKLYSDSDDIIFTFKKTVGMNGINMVLVRPDILERSLLFPLERMPDSNRLEEGAVEEMLEQRLPFILGGVFDTLSKAIQYKKDLKLRNPPRMADFATWGVAIAKALGYEDDIFLDAYNANIEQQNKEVLYEDTTASAVIMLFENLYRDGSNLLEWTGTASDLLGELKNLEGIKNVSENALPKSPSALSRKLNILEIPLKDAGITIEKIIGRTRELKISRNMGNAVDAADAVDNVHREFNNF